MTQVQYIERDGHREFAVVPIELWGRVKHLAEDLDDEALFDQAKAADDGFRVPTAVVDAELAGDHPVRAWRMRFPMCFTPHQPSYFVSAQIVRHRSLN